MFKFTDFDAVLRKDNPNYERVIRSELHTVVEILRNGGARVHLGELAVEMKKVSKQKWQKYARTRQYLEREFPGLKNLLKGKITNFRSGSLTKGKAGAIIHVLRWDSDTGDLADLQQLRVREHISWRAANAASRDYLLPEYQGAGEHYGMGNAAFTPGNLGKGDDTHAALGPFTPAIFNFNGPGQLEHNISQVYEFSEDSGASWKPIPNSRYSIQRKVSRVGQKVKLTITKTNADRPSDSCTNFTEV